MWGRNLVAKGLMYIMTSKALFIGLQPTDLTGKVVRDDYTVNNKNGIYKAQLMYISLRRTRK